MCAQRIILNITTKSISNINNNNQMLRIFLNQIQNVNILKSVRLKSQTIPSRKKGEKHKRHKEVKNIALQSAHDKSTQQTHS